MIESLIRLLRAPHERAARVRTVIHAHWKQELRRARRRQVVVVAAFVVVAALLVAILRRWMNF